MGEPPDRLAETRATASGAETVDRVVLHQSKYWTSLRAMEVEHGKISSLKNAEVEPN